MSTGILSVMSVLRSSGSPRLLPVTCGLATTDGQYLQRIFLTLEDYGAITAMITASDLCMAMALKPTQAHTSRITTSPQAG